MLLCQLCVCSLWIKCVYLDCNCMFFIAIVQSRLKNRNLAFYLMPAFCPSIRARLGRSFCTNNAALRVPVLFVRVNGLYKTQQLKPLVVSCSQLSWKTATLCAHTFHSDWLRLTCQPMLESKYSSGQLVLGGGGWVLIDIVGRAALIAACLKAFVLRVPTVQLACVRKLTPEEDCVL